MLLAAIASAWMTLYLFYQALKPLTDVAVVSAGEWQRVDDQTSALLQRRDRLVDELRDLELDAALNKVGGQDLTDLRARYEREAVDTVRQLDEALEPYQARIERDIGALSEGDVAQAQTEASVPTDEAPSIAADAIETSAPDERSTTCSACGAQVTSDARFCDACGAALSEHTCSGCGTQNRLNARFCRGCGERLGPQQGET